MTKRHKKLHFPFEPFEADKIRTYIADMYLKLEFYEDIILPMSELDPEDQLKVAELINALSTVAKAKKNIEEAT